MKAPIAAAEVARSVLPNGLTCLVRSVPGSGAVALHGYLKAGSMFDDAHPGAARFVGSLLVRGTARRTGPQIAEDLDAMGATLSIAPGIEVTALSARSLADDLPALLAAAAEVLVEPSFPPEEVERTRGELITAIRVNGLDTRQVAERAFRRLAYPAGHPHSESPDGEESVVGTLAASDLRAFHARHYRPEATILAVAGEVDAGRAVDLISEAFGAWRGKGTWTMPSFPAPRPPEAVQRADIAVPGKTQSDLVLGVPGIARSDPDYYAVMMANLIMGQLGMMGRIGQNVREKQGLAYHAFSDLRAGLLDGPWWVRAGVNPVNVDRAVAAILHEVRALQIHGPAAEELADARTFLVGSLAVRLETSAGIAQTLADIELFELGLDYLERYPLIINGTSRDVIVDAARRFPLDAYALAIAGPERQR